MCTKIDFLKYLNKKETHYEYHKVKIIERVKPGDSRSGILQDKVAVCGNRNLMSVNLSKLFMNFHMQCDQSMCNILNAVVTVARQLATIPES